MKHEKALEMIGERSGLLTVLDVAPSPAGTRYRTPWLRCRCDCGEEITAQPHMIAKALAKSCGCRSPRHGMSHTKEHNAWMKMHQRCTNPEDSAYDYIGAAGIEICNRWDRAKGGSFVNFYADLGPAPGPAYFLDRIDRAGDYTPENCKWTHGDNGARRNAKVHTIGEESRTVDEWAAHWGISRTGARHRLLNPDCKRRH